MTGDCGDFRVGGTAVHDASAADPCRGCGTTRRIKRRFTHIGMMMAERPKPLTIQLRDDGFRVVRFIPRTEWFVVAVVFPAIGSGRPSLARTVVPAP
jgi:hypothetical protein